MAGSTALRNRGGFGGKSHSIILLVFVSSDTSCIRFADFRTELTCGLGIKCPFPSSMISGGAAFKMRATEGGNERSKRKRDKGPKNSPPNRSVIVAWFHAGVRGFPLNIIFPNDGRKDAISSASIANTIIFLIGAPAGMPRIKGIRSATQSKSV